MTATIKSRIAKGGEEVAVDFLKKNGYRILERNWRSGRFGEIDIIAQEKNGLIVFVEVKTRRMRTTDFGIPEQGFEAVNWRKRRKIAITAASYLAKKQGVEQPARFDAIVVCFSGAGYSLEKQTAGCPQITHVKAAFYP